MAWVERGNPIPQNPETPTVLRAFRALEFRVVVDEFLTDTAREADVVLPAKSMFEQTDVIGALLARLPAAQAEGDRAAGRGEARVRGLPPAR